MPSHMATSESALCLTLFHSQGMGDSEAVIVLSFLLLFLFYFFFFIIFEAGSHIIQIMLELTV